MVKTTTNQPEDPKWAGLFYLSALISEKLQGGRLPWSNQSSNIISQ
jgi:hypothetical protein